MRFSSVINDWKRRGGRGEGGGGGMAQRVAAFRPVRDDAGIPLPAGVNISSKNPSLTSDSFVVLSLVIKFAWFVKPRRTSLKPEMVRRVLQKRRKFLPALSSIKVIETTLFLITTYILFYEDEKITRKLRDPKASRESA